MHLKHDDINSCIHVEIMMREFMVCLYSNNIITNESLISSHTQILSISIYIQYNDEFKDGFF